MMRSDCEVTILTIILRPDTLPRSSLSLHRTEEEEEEEELDKGFYSWTAQLDAELTEDPNLAQIQTSHNIGKESPSTAPQGTDVANDTEDSLLFELD